MRHPKLVMNPKAALELLGRAAVVHLASSTPDGSPILRTLHSVVHDGWLYFHSGRGGEQATSTGRAATVAAEEVVASLPSYFVDPELACPATTFYRSVQLHGCIEELHDSAAKASMLNAFMQKYQPEGGYAPLSAERPRYRGVLNTIRIFGIPIVNLSGKTKLGQNRSSTQLRAVMEGLWKRGNPGDAAAIEHILAANPDLPAPDFLVGPEGARLVCAVLPEHADAVLTLLEGQYWLKGTPVAALRQAHSGSAVWVAARSADGAWIGTGRAVSDGARHALLADIVVHPAWQRRGIGQALVTLLLKHPGVRHCTVIRLGTADAQPFYTRFGFQDATQVDFGFPVTQMVMRRPDAR